MRQTAILSMVLITLGLPIGACGSEDGASTRPPQPEPTGKPADFPSAKGRTMGELFRAVRQQGPVLAPSVSVLHKGTNRYGFALFDTARKQITGVKVAIYTARRDGSGLRGPYVARPESLAVKAAFESQTSRSDPDAAKTVYVADVPFHELGQHAVAAVVRLDGRMVATNAFSANVTGGEASPPAVGDKAIRVHTPTLADVGGDANAIDTRRPAATDLLKDDLASVLGKKAVVLTFATPLLCQSRVCGPVVDIVEQVRSTTDEEKVAFIHVEIYKDNDVSKGNLPQVAAWHLPTEPWTFVIDRHGRISDRFEGAFSVGELDRAVAKVE